MTRSKSSDREKDKPRRTESDSKENRGTKRENEDRRKEKRSPKKDRQSDRRRDDSKKRRYEKDPKEASDSRTYERYWNKETVVNRDEPCNKPGKKYEVGSRYYDKPSNNSDRSGDENAEDNVEVGSRYYNPSKKNDKKEDQEASAARKAKKEDVLTTKTGGAYIPPMKLRMMRAEITDKSSVPYQRLSWEALKKSIHGCINKVNTGNIAIIIKELLRENIVRGRGLLCRSVIQAQAASPTFSHVYAALIAAINSRFPNIGELLLKRLVVQFKRGFKRNDKATCISAVTFVAHLVNQRVSHEILALEILTLLVETPTDDSVEVAIAFLKECGQKLTEVSSKGINAILEMLRNILHEGQLDKRVQYMIEVMFQIRKDGFKDHVAVIEELELVPEEEQFTHLIMLDEVTDPQDLLNVFKFDPNYEDNEGKYKELSKEILGSDAESNSDDESGEESESESDAEEENQDNANKGVIIDNTETNLIALRRTIYLTIHSSLDFEECAHKLMKMQLKPGQEMELCHMFLDCCAEQRTYEKFYGLLAQRFCQINKIYIGPFEQIFKDSYGTAHRLDTNRLRNISKFFAHLLFTDAISWEALDCVKLNEEDTTSSSRIFVKILFQELAEYMGLGKLNERLKDPTLQEPFSGIFPRDNPKNTRFAINFFTSIGLGGLTDELREHLKQAPKVIASNQATKEKDGSSSSSSSSGSSSSSSSSSSDSSSSSGSSSDSSDSESSDDAKKKRKPKKSLKTKPLKNSKKDNPKETEKRRNEKKDGREIQSSYPKKDNSRYNDRDKKKYVERIERTDRPERTERYERTERIERSARPERTERIERSERPERTERIERSERPERTERIERSERPERTERFERSERPERHERPERIERTERPERIERYERTEKTERHERTERIERPEKTERHERIERPEKTERHERIERPEKTERQERTERPEKTERHERTERIERPEKTERHERIERTERPERTERHSKNHRNYPDRKRE